MELQVPVLLVCASVLLALMPVGLAQTVTYNGNQCYVIWTSRQVMNANDMEVLSTPSAVDVNQCVQMCIQTQGATACSGLSYNSLNQVCTLYQCCSTSPTVLEPNYWVNYAIISGCKSVSPSPTPLTLPTTPPVVPTVQPPAPACGYPVNQPYPQAFPPMSRQNVLPKSLPWMARLPSCTGVLVPSSNPSTSQVIITTRECIAQQGEVIASNPSQLTVLLGARDLSKQQEEGRVAVQAAQIIQDVNALPYGNNLAIVKLAEPVPYTPFIRPICLSPPGYTYTPGTVCLTAGWNYYGGLLGIGAIQGSIMQTPVFRLAQTYQPLDDQCICDGMLSLIGVPNNQQQVVCAGYPWNQPPLQTTDIGWPLMCQVGGLWVLEGMTLVSPTQMKSSVGFYTRINAFRNWVQQATGAPFFAAVQNVTR